MKKNFLKYFTKDKEGATAIEFAIIAFPFFLLFMGIIELGLTIFIDSSLNSGVRTVARQGVASGYSSLSEVSPILEAHMAGTYRDISAASSGIDFRMVALSDVTDAKLAAYSANPDSIFSEPATLPSINAQNGKIIVYAARYKWDGFTALMAPLLPDNLYAITVVKNEAF